ncbi:universal stress protein [Streptomyces sp. NBC_01565]|uniref:universal stress protein n=1 Tax=Streptomyces sp. NBC_01565 TaxID=2975881 RepID=UPI00224FB43A|nr:universal stress protein [Streptomyces sp. NBC_01565]MCX4544925.1 universal stress protein [Streptomyces sp. NBC_01565]
MRARVVVGTGGSLGSLAALHRAAAEARARDAELWVVLAWQPPGGGLGGRGSCGLSVLDGCRSVAVERLREILGTAFGERPPGVTLAGLTARGTPGAALVDAVHDPGDLLVVGTGSRGPLLRALAPSVARYCVAHAPCPVLAVPPSPLQANLTAVRRRNAWRMPLDARELAR